MDERKKDSRSVFILKSNMNSITETIQSHVCKSEDEYITCVVKESFNKYDDLEKRTNFIQKIMQTMYGGKWSVWIYLDEDNYCSYYRKSHYIHLKIGGYYVIIYNNN